MAPSDAAWHLDTVEVACKAGGPAPRPAFFACRRWLDERCGYRAELAASASNPRQEEVEYKVGRGGETGGWWCSGGAGAPRAAWVTLGWGGAPRDAWLSCLHRCVPLLCSWRRPNDTVGGIYRASLPACLRPLPPAGQVVVYTSSLPGCGCTGNAFVELQGERGESGVLTLRNKGGSFRPGQVGGAACPWDGGAASASARPLLSGLGYRPAASKSTLSCCPRPHLAQVDEFAFRLPGLGSLTQLHVGHDGRRDWHLERLEVVDPASGTTHYFPCDKASTLCCAALRCAVLCCAVLCCAVLCCAVLCLLRHTVVGLGE